MCLMIVKVILLSIFEDKDGDIFFYHTDITGNNPNKLLRSLA